MNPLFCMLRRHLPGKRIGDGEHGFSVVAYAGDIALLFTDKREKRLALEIIRIYERATKPRLNLRKSKAMAVGAWDTLPCGMEIPYYQDIKMLGVRIASTIGESQRLTWTVVADNVKTVVRVT
jgi:hypothetical protein